MASTEFAELHVVSVFPEQLTKMRLVEAIGRTLSDWPWAIYTSGISTPLGPDLPRACALTIYPGENAMT